MVTIYSEGRWWSTTAEVARMLEVTERHVRRLAATGRLPHMRIGTLLLLDWHDALAYGYTRGPYRCISTVGGLRAAERMRLIPRAATPLDPTTPEWPITNRRGAIPEPDQPED